MISEEELATHINSKDKKDLEHAHAIRRCVSSVFKSATFSTSRHESYYTLRFSVKGQLKLKDVRMMTSQAVPVRDVICKRDDRNCSAVLAISIWYERERRRHGTLVHKRDLTATTAAGATFDFGETVDEPTKTVVTSLLTHVRNLHDRIPNMFSWVETAKTKYGNGDRGTFLCFSNIPTFSLLCLIDIADLYLSVHDAVVWFGPPEAVSNFDVLYFFVGKPTEPVDVNSVQLPVGGVDQRKRLTLSDLKRKQEEEANPRKRVRC